jgi:NitT/TauT family transport system substrate-binding protein
MILLLFAQCHEPAPKTGETPLSKVRFGMLPYGDHTYAIIGAEKGWFREVGIDLSYEPVKIDAIIPMLKAGTMDVISTPPGILFASYDNAPDLCSFVFGDLFQGYAILAQPASGLKSVQEFIAEGKSDSAAIVAAVQQLKGKKLASPAEAAIRPFIETALAKGGLKISQIRQLVMDDPLTVNAMRNKQADLQVGGVPSRLVLQREGFKPIITSIDLVKLARPSSTSKELASILQNGWATSKSYYQQHHDIVLRMASVNYRIMDLINHSPAEALKIHMPYLTKVSGQSFSEKEGEIIYHSLDPFFTFADQGPWFHDKLSPLYFEYVNGSIVNNYISQHIYKGTPPTVNDVIFADDIYYEMEALKAGSDSVFRLIDEKHLGDKNNGTKDQYAKARAFYEKYDFLDAKKAGEDIIKGSGQ